VTLALICLTPEFVTVVADRRLTDGAAVVDDSATKVVVICDRGAVAYSGLARLPNGPRMDEWIVQSLATHKVATLSHAARVLKDEATLAFRNLPYTRAQSRHAFIVAGWTVTAASNRFPAVAVVSNALDDNWDWLPVAETEFRQRVFVQQDSKKFSLTSIGASLPAERRDNLRRTLRRGFPKGLGPAAVLRLSVRTIRAIAASDPTVGIDLLGVCIPPCSLTPGPRLMLAGGPNPGSVTFLDFKVPFEVGTWRGPHFVCGGSAMAGVSRIPQGEARRRRLISTLKCNTERHPSGLASSPS